LRKFLTKRETFNFQLPPGRKKLNSMSADPNAFWHLLLALAAVVVVGRLLGQLFRFVGQPPVIGEVVGGIVLGPSLLGYLFPAAYLFILPPAIASSLNVFAQLGIVIYMFLVGLELNPEFLRSRIRSTIAISHASIVLPFGLGAGLAWYIYPRFSANGVPFTSFALFLGLAMSITAFPVLARILSDSGLNRTELGTIALTCAATGDVTAWCLLAFVAGVVQASATSIVSIAALTVGFIAFMFIVVRPFIVKAVRAKDDRYPAQGTIVFNLAGMLLAAVTTEAIGIHAIFGAFLFGAVIPHDSMLARVLKQSLENLVTVLLLPAFFAFTGMRTQIGLVSGVFEWAVCGLIIAVATFGKFGGSFLAARVTGMAWRPAAAIGVLMNTRGLMELIVLNVGLDLGVISPTLFTMLVLMALATTLATTPILQRLIRGSTEAEEHALVGSDQHAAGNYRS
jgi:Kef-type K+ transport system membrane component KefB